MTPSSPRRVLAACCLVLSLPLAAGCADDEETSAPSGSGAPPRRVLVLGIDGVRADALQAADTPAIDRLVAEGASSFEVSTQVTTVAESSPGWASILTGVEADRHGVLNNGMLREVGPEHPTFLLRASTLLGSKPKLVTNWIGIMTLVEDAAENGETDWIADDEGVAARAVELVEAGGHDVYFLQFDGVDHAGHEFGFGPDVPEYVAAIEERDAYVADLVAALETRTSESWLLLLTSDHGGEGTSHGAQDAVNQTVFLIAWGDGVEPGTIAAGATHMDTAPTALRFLGATIDPAWELDGEVVAIP